MGRQPICSIMPHRSWRAAFPVTLDLMCPAPQLTKLAGKLEKLVNYNDTFLRRRPPLVADDASH